MKNLIGFVLTLAALAVFVLFGQIQWIPGLIMAVGNVLGGYVGAMLAIQQGRRLIFAFLIVVMVATGLKLIWPSPQNSAQKTNECPVVSSLILDDLSLPR